jgi:hypothetical protein
MAISPIRKSRFVKGLSELLLFFDALTRAENRERMWLTAPLKRQMPEALPNATSAGPPAFQTLSLAPGALQCVEEYLRFFGHTRGHGPMQEINQ